VIKNKTQIAQEKKKKRKKAFFFLFSFGIDFVSIILALNHIGENSIAKCGLVLHVVFGFMLYIAACKNPKRENPILK
jgi:hypothetical protein